MKKIFYMLEVVLLLCPLVAYAIADNQKSNAENVQLEEDKTKRQETVVLEECIDMTTVKLRNTDDEIFKAKLLGIDEADSEDILNSAKQYVCNSLVSASKIVIEYDTKGKEEDSYGRKLVWLFVDDELLQNQLVLNGYAKVNSLYELYEYTLILQDSEITAKKNNIGLWQTKEEVVNSDTPDAVKKKKNFFQELFDNVLGAIAKFLDDILEKILSLIEDML